MDVERWTAFWKDRFSKRCGNPAWRWQRGLFHHRLSASVSQTTRHFGWNDLAAKFVARVKTEDGLEHRTDIVTSFDLIDLREGREHEKPNAT